MELHNKKDMIITSILQSLFWSIIFKYILNVNMNLTTLIVIQTFIFYIMKHPLRVYIDKYTDKITNGSNIKK